MATHLGKPIQEATVTLLKANSGVSAIVSDRVYGPRAPQGATFPYVCCNVVTTAWDTKDTPGHEAFIRLQGFTRGGTDSPLAEAANLRAALYAAMHRVKFAVAGGSMVLSTQSGLDDIGFEPDNETAQCVIEFRCPVQGT